MKHYLEETGLYSVDVARSKHTWKGDDLISQYPIEGLPKTEVLVEPKPIPILDPTFLNMTWSYPIRWKAAAWPEETHPLLRPTSVVVVDLSLSTQPTTPSRMGCHNKMIDWRLGWAHRKDGPPILRRHAKASSRPLPEGAVPWSSNTLSSHNRCGSPITQGLPTEWLHTKDELYAQLRGPAENIDVLATAYSDPKTKGQAA